MLRLYPALQASSSRRNTSFWAVTTSSGTHVYRQPPCLREVVPQEVASNSWRVPPDLQRLTAIVTRGELWESFQEPAQLPFRVYRSHKVRNKLTTSLGRLHRSVRRSTALRSTGADTRLRVITKAGVNSTVKGSDG